MHFKEKVLKFILTLTLLVLVTVGLGHVVYRKLYSLIGSQRAKTFENHWSITINFHSVKDGAVRCKMASILSALPRDATDAAEDRLSI